MDKKIIAGYNAQGLLKAIIYKGKYIELLGQTSEELNKELKSKEKDYPGIYEDYINIMKKLYEITQLKKQGKTSLVEKLKKEVDNIYKDVNIEELYKLKEKQTLLSPSNKYYRLYLCNNLCSKEDDTLDEIIKTTKTTTTEKNIFFFIICEEEITQEVLSPFPVIGQLQGDKIYDIITNEEIKINPGKQALPNLSYYYRVQITSTEAKEYLKKLKKEDLERYKEALEVIKNISIKEFNNKRIKV